MHYNDLHPFKGLSRDAMEQLQEKLVPEISAEILGLTPRYVCGVDVAYDRRQNRGYCAIVTLDYKSGEICDTVYSEGEVYLPYIPGFLAFRELPLFLSAWEKQQIKPDIVFFDGNGRMHRKRFGIASHAGLFIGIPTIGIAKSYLCGVSEELGELAGDQAQVEEGGEIIGVRLRTKKGCKPVYVSVGHGLSLEEALKHTVHLVESRYRIPRITRLADKASKQARDGK